MNYKRAATVLFMGLTAMLLSGIGGYYWASQSKTTPRITQTSVKEKPDQSTEQTMESSSDTKPLTPQNWQAFLRYEGERRRMLGVKKTFSEVNFREGPGMEYSIIATPQGGELLTILDRVRNWYRARLADGRIGWIHKSVIRVLQVPLPIAKSFHEKLPPLKESTKKLIPEDFKDNSRIKVTVSKALLRGGPGTQFPLAGRLYKFQEVRLLGKRKNWYRIVTPTRSTAWIRADLAKPIWTIPPKKQKTVRITTRDLRMGPEYQFRNPIKSDDDVKATLLERLDPWFLVKLNEKQIGWVHETEIIDRKENG